MTLRPNPCIPHRGPVPQYDSHAFGSHGRRVRIYRLKPGGSFYIEYDQGRKRKVIRPKVRTLDLALDYMGRFYRDYSKGINALEAGRLTLALVLDAYRDHRTVEKSLSEQKADARRAAMFRARWGTRAPSEITLADWEAFARDRKGGGGGRMVRPRTVVADLLWLRGVLGWAAKWRRVDGTYLLTENPVRGYRIPPDSSPRRPVATQDRLEAILGTIEPLEGTRDASGREVLWPADLRLLLTLGNGTGRRLSSLLHLRASDLLLDQGPYGSIRWRAEHDKKGRETVVPIAKAVRAEILRYLAKHPKTGDVFLVQSRRGKRSRPLTRSGADRMLRRAERLAKLAPLSGSLWHVWRRKWATERKHLPLPDVAYAGGWKDARTLQTVYQQPDERSVLRVVTEPVELRERR